MKEARRARALALLAALAAPQQETDRGADHAIEVRFLGPAAGGSVEFGRPFELEVVRRWPTDATAEPWGDEVLAPLTVEQAALSRVESAGRVVETRRFVAWAFRRGAVALQPEFALVVPEGAPPRRVTAELTPLLIDSSLPADDDGSAESLPLPPLQIVPVRRTLVRLLLLAAAAGAAAFALARAVRWLAARRARVAGPRAALLARLDELARAEPAARNAQRAHAVAATAVLRDAERLVADAGQRPDDALVAARDAAHRILDDVKFAGRELTAEERAELLLHLRRAVAAVPREPAPAGATA